MNTSEKNIIDKIKNIKNLIDIYNYNYEKNDHLHDACNFDDAILASRQFDIFHLIISKKINKVSELSKYLDLSASSLSITISKMCNQNFLEKSYDETLDARNVILKPTEQGMTIYKQIKLFFINSLKEFYMSLNSDEVEIFSSALYDLSQSLQFYKIDVIEKTMELDALCELIFSNLFKLKVPFERFFRDAKNKYKTTISLTDKEIRLLSFLLEPDINSPSDLSKITYTKESTISTQLKNLVKKGYLTKEKSDKDIRKTYFIITDLGKETLENDIKIIENIFTELIKTFSEDDKINLTNGLLSLEVLFNLLLKHKI